MPFPRWRAPDVYDPGSLLIATLTVGSIYWNRRDKLEEALNIIEGPGEWQMLLWQFRDNLLQPSICMFQVRGPHVVIGVAGSVGTLHWMGNIEGGAMPRSYGGSSYAHHFFFELAGDLYDEILPLLPPNIGTIRLCGHSLGAACTNLMANFLMAQGHDVEVLNFAEPRSVSAGLQVPHPSGSRHTRVYIGNDAIGWVPSRNLGQYWLFRPGWHPWSSEAFTWGHYGWRADYALDGTPWTFDYDRDDISFISRPIQETLVAHPIGSYMRAFNQLSERSMNGNDWRNLETIGREIYNQGVDRSENNIRINPNNILNISGARAFLNIPDEAPQDIDLNLVEWGGFEMQGNITSFVQIHPDAPTDIGIGFYNMAGSTTNLWKVEFLIEDGKYWYTESHVHNESLDFDQIFTAAEGLWEMRRKLVGRKAANSTLGGGSPGCSNVRMSQVLHPKIAFSKRLENQPQLGEYEASLGSAKTLNNGILCRMHATQPGGGTVAEGVRHFAIRAVPDSLIVDGRKVDLAVWDQAATLWAAYLINNNWGIMVQDQLTPNDKKPVTAFAQDATTKIWTLDVDATNYQSLDTVRISNTSVPEMNGTYKIVKVSNTQIKLLKGPESVSSNPIAGECQRVRLKSGTQCKVFAKYDEIRPTRECDRDVTLKLKKAVG